MFGIEKFMRYSPPGAAYCLADWRRYLGEDFGKAEPHLEKVTGRITGSYPDAGGNVRYEVRLHGDFWLGVPMEGGEESDDAPWPRLTAEDVQLWRLSGEGRSALLRDCSSSLAGDRGRKTEDSEGLAVLMLRGAEEKKDMAYVVSDKFRINGDFSQVTTLDRKGDVWEVPPFTRMVLKVLLGQCQQGGLSGEVIYDRAKAEFERLCPESAQRAHGMEMIPKPASIIQFFRRQRKGRKQTHPLYAAIRIIGRKPATYSLEGMVMKTPETQRNYGVTPDKV